MLFKFDILVHHLRLLFGVLLIISLSGCGDNMEEIFNDPKLRNLISAAQKGDKEEVKKLVQSGVDLNKKGVEGVTALHWVMHKNDLAGMKILLEQGANPNLPFTKGEIENVLELAVGKGKEEYLLLLLEFDGDPNFKGSKRLIEHAISYGQKNTIRVLLRHGADVLNDHDRGVFSAMDYAASFKQYDFVEMFLEHGADPLHVDRDGSTFVHSFQEYKSDSASYKNIGSLLNRLGVIFPIPSQPQTGVAKFGKNLNDPEVRDWLENETLRINRNFNIYMHIIDYYLAKKSSDLKLPIYPEYIVHGDAHKDDVFRSEYKEKVANYYMEAASFLDTVEPDWRNDSPYFPPEFKGGDGK